WLRSIKRIATSAERLPVCLWYRQCCRSVEPTTQGQNNVVIDVAVTLRQFCIEGCRGSKIWKLVQHKQVKLGGPLAEVSSDPTTSTCHQCIDIPCQPRAALFVAFRYRGICQRVQRFAVSVVENPSERRPTTLVLPL